MKKSISEVVKERRKRVRITPFPIGIDSLVLQYQENSLVMNPKYQRFFRWTQEDKSKFIESIFMGIPTPSVFVFVNEQYQWEVIDGLQRLSSVFEFRGILKNNNGTEESPLVLSGLERLPDLNGQSYQDLPHDLKRLFGQYRIDLFRLDEGTPLDVKYELFQAINTTGKSLSSQEVRNCRIVSKSERFYNYLEEKFYSRYSSIEEISESEDTENIKGIDAVENVSELKDILIRTKFSHSFTRLLGVSDSKVKEKYEIELFCRCLFLMEQSNLEQLTDRSKGRSFSLFMDNYMEQLASNYEESENDKNSIVEHFKLIEDVVLFFQDNNQLDALRKPKSKIQIQAIEQALIGLIVFIKKQGMPSFLSKINALSDKNSFFITVKNIASESKASGTMYSLDQRKTNVEAGLKKYESFFNSVQKV